MKCLIIGMLICLNLMSCSFTSYGRPIKPTCDDSQIILGLLIQEKQAIVERESYNIHLNTVLKYSLLGINKLEQEVRDHLRKCTA